jgi:hypothetical protein
MSALPTIPQTAFVPCPKAGFKNVRVATSCPGCEHFRGLVKVDRQPQASFIQAMRVGCAHPVTRTMIHVEV